jgi:hypothetical protein
MIFMDEIVYLRESLKSASSGVLILSEKTAKNGEQANKKECKQQSNPDKTKKLFKRRFHWFTIFFVV